MSEVIKSCHNCKATSGFMCQQCYDMRCWEFDSVRNEKYLRERAEWKIELNEEIRADERKKFAEWLCEHNAGIVDADNEEWKIKTIYRGIESVIKEYEKEQKNV